jgi:hypothetical protein
MHQTRVGSIFDETPDKIAVKAAEFINGEYGAKVRRANSTRTSRIVNIVPAVTISQRQGFGRLGVNLYG